ncbi:MAG TPA: hypothetical protein VK791_08625 [bacterium]|jgi:hypothetical protein|nr:hypothetical protein [bacterium]
MKKIQILTAVILMSASQAVLADSMHKTELKSEQPIVGKTMKAEVIDVACYIKKGEHGEDHQGCAAKCISEGGELALLIDGKLCVPVDKDFHSARGKFITHGGEVVTITGKILGKDGVNYVILTKPVKSSL